MIKEFLEMMVVEYVLESKLVKKITCKLCSEVIFNVSDSPTQPELDKETVGLSAHMEFRHGIKVETVRCSDPKCLGGHHA